jgi:hypothetical protein
MKIAIYTCITGNYDTLRSPLRVDRQFDYFCFSDDATSVGAPWIWRPIPTAGLTPQDQNRYVKMHPHVVLPEYDATIYLDGSVEIVGDVGEMVKNALASEGDLFLYDHSERTCTYREAAACAHFSHEWIWVISRQMRRYCREGFPPDSGLYEANVILRRNVRSIAVLMDQWWEEYMAGVKRDQLSLRYVSWKLRHPISTLGKNDPRLVNRYFRVVSHKSRRNLHVMPKTYVNRAIGRLLPFEWIFHGPRSGER